LILFNDDILTRQSRERRRKFSDQSAYQADTVSKANCSFLDAETEKFNFSNPITLPDLSFIKTTSSPVSSQIYSS